MAYGRGAIGDGLTAAIGGGGGGGPNYAESASDDRSTREVFFVKLGSGHLGRGRGMRSRHLNMMFHGVLGKFSAFLLLHGRA